MTPPLLFNSLGRTGDVYVRAGDRLVKLPAGPQPALLFTGAGREPQRLRIAETTDFDAIVEVDIDMYTSHDVIGGLGLPARMDGVWYLVEPETMRQFPQRDDFVAPAVWSYAQLDGHEDQPDVDDDSEDWGVSVLVGITRLIDPVADENTAMIDWPDDDEWDEPDPD